MIIAAIMLLLQVPNAQRVTVTPAADSGTLPFSVEIPKSWVKNGKWPHPAKGSEDIDFQCGPNATMTLSVTLSKLETQGTVSQAFGIVKKKHPGRYWTFSGQLGKGVIVEVPVRTKFKSMDYLTGRYYAGSHKVAFFQWSATGRMASASDRKLLTALVGSVKPSK